MLYVTTQNDIDFSTISNILQQYKITQWIYFGEDTTWRIRAESIIPSTIPRLSIVNAIEKKSWDLRTPFIDWIGELSEKNDSFEWWSSEIAAKNPYNMLFTRICYLSIARDIVLKGIPSPTLAICSSPIVCDEIGRIASQNHIPYTILRSINPLTRLLNRSKSSLQLIQQFGGTVVPQFPLERISERYFKFLEKNHSYRVKILKKYPFSKETSFSGKNTHLIFTWVDNRSFSKEGTYQDTYFGPLPEMLRNKGYEVAFVPKILFSVPFEDTVKKMSKTREQFYFPELFFLGKDWISSLMDSIKFNPRIPQNATLDGVPVYAIARELIQDSRSLLPDNLIYKSVIKNMAGAGIRPHYLVYTCEGHSWELALSWAVRRFMPETKIFGYDNVTFSRLVLSMFPSRNEFSIRPLPDYIVTNGPLFRDTLISEGVPQNRIRTGCALRHTYLWTSPHVQDNHRSVKSQPPLKILAATAIGYGDSVELIKKTACAFGGDRDYEVMIKCHPLVNVSEIKNDLGTLLKQDNIHFESRPIGELLPEVDVLLYTYTSVCYEALMHGVFPIFVLSENFINLDKLDAVPDIRWKAATSDDLRKLIKSFREMPDKTYENWKKKAHDVVLFALSPINEKCAESYVE